MTMCSVNPSCVWQHDICPAAKVHRSVDVGVGNVPASLTPKHSLGRTISLLGESALRALSTAVSRVNENNDDTSKVSFVLGFCHQVMKCPRVQRSALRPVSPNPRTYPFEVLEEKWVKTQRRYEKCHMNRLKVRGSAF
jgi:hypothetical protein